MSSAPSTDTAAPKRVGFFGMLLAFTGFAVLLVVLQAIGGGESADPRGEERLAARMSVQEAQSALIAKLGLDDDVKSDALFEKSAATLAQKKPSKSAQVVPGSPTQLKMAAAEAAAAATATPPAAEGEAPAAPAPATAQ